MREHGDVKLMSIREIAATGILSEYSLRMLVKQKKIPALMVGRKALINYNQLIEQLKNL